MKQYFVDSTGKIFEADIPGYKKLHEYRKKYRMATFEERKAYLRGQEIEEREFAVKNGLKDVFFMAPTKNKDGYGNSSVNIKRRAVKYGYHLNTTDTKQQTCLCYHLPNTLSLVHNPVKISFTMFESDQYPQFWEPYLKSADHVVVPTTFCAEIMEKNFGIKPEVIPLGFDPDFFYFLDRSNRPEGHKFTFLHYDAFKWRKGWDLVFTAFTEEFSEDEDVELVFKTTLGVSPNFEQYSNIRKIVGQLDQEEMHEVLSQADCFVFPTRGEGFGLTPLEAMATGMRAIVPNHTGIKTYFDPRYCVDLDCMEIKAKYDNTELRKLDLGTQWEPTITSLRQAMRTEFEDWKANGKKLDIEHSKQIAEYAKGFSIEATTKKVCEMLDKFVS